MQPAGRQINGHFAPGNKIAQGNALTKLMHELKRAYAEQPQHPEKVYKALDRLYEYGMTTEYQALVAWLNYFVPKAPIAAEISGPEGSNLNVGTILRVVLEAVGDEPEIRARVASSFRQLAGEADKVIDVTTPATEAKPV